MPTEHHQTITPFLLCDDAAAVLRFVVDAFDATEVSRVVGEAGNIVQAELRIGASRVMLGEPDAAMRARLTPTPAHLYVIVPDVHRAYRRALSAGATSFSKPIGPRLGAVNDPSGNFWWMATAQILSPEVSRRRHATYVAKRVKRETRRKTPHDEGRAQSAR
jgi:PhnB protein